MKCLPSRAVMEEVSITLHERASVECREGYPEYAARLRGVADFLESLAAEQEPEEPKVESLREAARRLGARHMDAQAVHADIAAIVLRRHRRLLELLRDEFVTSDMVSEVGVHALRDELDEVNQMLEGSE